MRQLRVQPVRFGGQICTILPQAKFFVDIAAGSRKPTSSIELGKLSMGVEIAPALAGALGMTLSEPVARLSETLGAHLSKLSVQPEPSGAEQGNSFFPNIWRAKSHKGQTAATPSGEPFEPRKDPPPIHLEKSLQGFSSPP